MAASTAVKMNAKKLVLSHVGAQYVPGSRDDESSSESLLSEVIFNLFKMQYFLLKYDRSILI